MYDIKTHLKIEFLTQNSPSKYPKIGGKESLDQDRFSNKET